MGFPAGSVVDNLLAMQENTAMQEIHPWVRKIPWIWKWQPTPVFVLGKFHEQRSLVGYSPWVTEMDTT